MRYKLPKINLFLWSCGVIVIIAILLRLVIYNLGVTIPKDALLYFDLAQKMSDGENIFLTNNLNSSLGIPPLFPLLLSYINTFFNNFILSAFLLNTSVNVFSIIIFAFIVMFLTKDKAVSLLCMLLAAIHPSLIDCSIECLRESLYLFFVLAGIGSFFIFFQKSNLWGYCCLSGIFLGMGSLTRIETIEVIPILFLWYIFACFFKKIKAKNFFYCAIIFISGWLISLEFICFAAPCSWSYIFSYYAKIDNYIF